MGKAPAFQFYPGDWLSSETVLSMTPEEEGAYIHLLAIAWMTDDCGLPDDDQALAALSRLGERWFNGCSTIVRRKFFSKGERLFNQRLLDERKKQAERAKKCGVSGVASGKARNSAKLTCERTFNERSTNVERNTNSSSSSSFAVKKERAKKESAHPPFSLPEWFPKETWVLFIDHRRKVKAPLTEKAYPAIVRKFDRLRDRGWSPDQVVDVLVEKGWRWFNPDWESVKKQTTQPQPQPEPRQPDTDLEERRRMADDPEYMRVPDKLSNLLQFVGKGIKNEKP